VSTTTSAPQMREPRRAAHAMKAVGDMLAKFPAAVKGNERVPHEKAKKYGGQAKKMPTRIIASGLGQALAFALAKGETNELLIELGNWVLDVMKPAADVAKQLGRPEERLLRAAVLGSADFLRRATDEALAYLQWVNRFCEANGLGTETENS
jgi:CRISPR-associated protein Cmr5